MKMSAGNRESNSIETYSGFEHDSGLYDIQRGCTGSCYAASKRSAQSRFVRGRPFTAEVVLGKKGFEELV